MTDFTASPERLGQLLLVGAGEQPISYDLHQGSNGCAGGCDRNIRSAASDSNGTPTNISSWLGLVRLPRSRNLPWAKA